MERLTERVYDGLIIIKQDSGDEGNYKAADKLATYEDLEEQGLLVRLPCSIGTTVWDIYGTGIRKNVVSGIEYGKDGRWFLWANEDEWLGELNVVVFLTREEAAKKLEEMKTYQHLQYCINIAAQSVRMTVSDVHSMNIARNVSWGVREIRAR